MNIEQQYSIELHRHNYARWCAARAYGRGLKGGGNKTAFDLIEAAGLREVTSPDQIGEDVDKWLLSFMRKIEAEAKRKGKSDFTFGHAQKLVNIYFKTILVCGGYHEHERVQRLHPPLDLELFKGLAKYFRKNNLKDTKAAIAFAKAQKANSSWTSFTESDYIAHIEAIRLAVGNRPFYEAEEHWSL